LDGGALELALAEVAAAPDLIVAMDFDGTLSPIVDRPDAARPDPEAHAALLRIAALPRTRVVVISGRALADLGPRLGAPEGAVDLIGSHGAEDSAGAGDDGEAIDSLVRTAQTLAGRYAGVILEPKPFSVAIHYRSVADEEQPEVLAWASENLEPMAAKHTHGKKVVEFFTRSADKGVALERYRERLHPTARPPLVFAGDDVTDEAAFQVMAPPDVSVKVGEGGTAARFRLLRQEEVAALLRRILELRADAVGRAAGGG
jgi:trehalose 6-phosphate phosphatase